MGRQDRDSRVTFEVTLSVLSRKNELCYGTRDDDKLQRIFPVDASVATGAVETNAVVIDFVDVIDDVKKRLDVLK